MKRGYLKFLCWIMLSALAPAVHSQVSFIEEYIDFSLDSHYFTVNGIYKFVNNSFNKATQKIIFPFATETAFIDSIRIFNLQEFKSIPFSRQHNSISFDLEITSSDTLEINLFYRQPAANKNSYILSSTQYWNKPLKKAVYTLTTPFGYKIQSFSFPPDQMKSENNHHVYIWHKQDFLPEMDFEVVGF